MIKMTKTTINRAPPPAEAPIIIILCESTGVELGLMVVIVMVGGAMREDEEVSLIIAVVIVSDVMNAVEEGSGDTGGINI